MLKIQPRLYDESLETMNFLNEVIMRYPQAISFAPGRPIEDYLDVKAYLSELDRFVTHYAKRIGATEEATFKLLGQYGHTKGIIGDLIAKHLEKDENIQVDESDIVVTVGCQEGMAILLMTLFGSDQDVLLVSDPSYVGITGTAQILGVNVKPVPMKQGDLQPEDVARAVDEVRAEGKRPVALYHIPDFNNPLGISMSLANRKRLLELAKEKDFLIFEDNPYGMFAYDGAPPATLKSLDTAKRVIYMGTFSKTLCPGLRVGYLVADQQVADAEGRAIPLVGPLTKVKSFLTVNTSQVVQGVAGGILLAEDFSLKEMNQPKVDFYHKNRDVMVEELQKALAGVEGIEIKKPGGGFFMSVILPFEVDEAAVTRCAAEYGVIFCPMSIFSLRGEHRNEMRLSFSFVTPESIRKGIAALARFIRDQVG